MRLAAVTGTRSILLCRPSMFIRCIEGGTEIIGNHLKHFEAVSDPKAVGVDVTRGKARTPFPNRLGHHRPVVSIIL